MIVSKMEDRVPLVGNDRRLGGICVSKLYFVNDQTQRLLKYTSMSVFIVSANITFRTLQLNYHLLHASDIFGHNQVGFTIRPKHEVEDNWMYNVIKVGSALTVNRDTDQPTQPDYNTKMEVLSLLSQTAGFWQNDGREARYKKLRITCLKYIWYDNLGKRV
jgi:hypothetical protein